MPSHVGVDGNERVDALASAACTYRPPQDIKFLGVISSYYLDAPSFRTGANHGNRLQLLIKAER